MLALLIYTEFISSSQSGCNAVSFIFRVSVDYYVRAGMVGILMLLRIDYVKYDRDRNSKIKNGLRAQIF